MTLKYKLQKLPYMPQRILRRFQTYGVLKTVGWAGYSMAWRLRERRLGIDTREHAYGLDVYGSNGGQGYEPIDYSCLDIILDYLQPDPERDVLLDYGCGLGRAVIAAAMRPFRRVLGIEIDDQLFPLASQHVEQVRSRSKLRCEVELIHGDAGEYTLPPDVNRVLMYNAFVGDLMQRVLERIRNSLAEAPRDLAIVYVPLKQHGNELEDCPWLSFRKQLPTGYWYHVNSFVYDADLGKI